MKPIQLRACLLGSGLLALLGAGSAFGQPIPVIVRGPYLQSATTSNIVVRWRTDVPTESRVRFGTVASNLNSEVSDPTLATEHALTLSGLAPDTKYSYAITAGIYLLVGGPSYDFTTPPASPKPTRIWAIGDCGTASFGSSAPLAVRDGYASFTGARPTDVWLMLGDNAYYSGTDEEYQSAVFDVFQQLLRTTPLWSALGNHETYAADGFGNIAYLDIFDFPRDGRAGGVPSGTERYYSFDYGSIHFVCLDSEISDKSAGGPMVTWLEEDLAANSKDWLIAFWHSPPYSRGSHNSDVEANLFLMRESVVPVLENYGVDLVLCGHSHSYERSYLLNGHHGPSSSLTAAMVVDGGSGRPNETGAYLKSPTGAAPGAVYVVAGSAGQTSGGLLNHPAMFVSLNRLGSMVIDVESNRLDASFVRETGVVEDRFSIFKGPVAPAILAHPTSQAVTEGDLASFSVTASGTPPLSYHWSFNGAAIADAGSSVLSLANVQAAQAGEYSVIVSNAHGVAASSNAVLVVNPPPPPSTNCLAAPSGLVAWWNAEGNVDDVLGGNPGQLRNGAGFGPGKVGQGFLLDGVNDFISVPDSATLDLTNELTMEFWLKSDSASWGFIIDKSDGSTYNYGVNITPEYGVQLFYNDPTVFGGDHPGNLLEIAAHFPLPSVNEFHHFAGSYRQADASHIELKMYLDGALVETRLFNGSLSRTVNNAPITLGGARGTCCFFRGVIDEVSLYNRALSAPEVQAIFAADALGKCASNTPPVILAQPVDQSLFQGQTARFEVFAVGARLAYHWLFNGAPIDGATNSSLVLSDVQLNQTGTYAVWVSSAGGEVTSSNAVLTVNVLPECFAPSGLVSWWTGDGSADDLVGGNHGILRNGAGFGSGIVGQGFLLDGLNDFIEVPDSATLDLTNALTIEFWLKSHSASWGVLLDKSDGGTYNYGLNINAQYGVQLVYNDPTVFGGDHPGNIHEIAAHFPLPSVNEFHHFAGSYRQADASHIELSMYLDGALVETRLFNGSLSRTVNNASITIGGSRGSCCFFQGVIDEISLYDRILSGTEVSLIHASGPAGKCSRDIPPVITRDAANQTVTQGETVNLSVGASGSRPLVYQWFFNGEAIAGETNATVTLVDVLIAQSGNYSVRVSNGYGSVTSAAATLTVLPPPSALRVVSVAAGSGGVAEVPVQLVANGQENAIGFSLVFDPSVLELDAIDLGPDAPGEASLLVNNNDGASGRVGVAVALPAGQTLSVGARALVSARFKVALVLSPVTTTISFGDVPTARQVANALAQSLPATYAAGTVAVARVEFEADVAPRPAGDFGVTIVDWVQMGRFVARLDGISGSNEFQRADCAPRATKGNGLLTVSDWVQAGRYAVGLDPLTVLGGPTEESSGEGGFIAAAASGRQLCLVNTSIAQGQTSSVPVTLECQGNENAASFSVVFDQSKLGFVSASPSAGSAGSLINLNTSEAAQGRLGVALAAQPGRTFAAGMREILQLRFSALVSAPATATLSFGNVPVPREVSDVAANPLPTEYTAGAVSVTPPPGPPLRVTRSGNSLFITWPSSATGFELEGTEGGFGSAWVIVPGVIDLGEQKLAIIPIGSGERYFRLKKP